MKLSVNETIPVAPLKIVALSSCKELGNKVDKLIVEMRKKVIANDTEKGLNVLGFDADSYILDADAGDSQNRCDRGDRPRFIDNVAVDPVSLFDGTGRRKGK